MAYRNEFVEVTEGFKANGAWFSYQQTLHLFARPDGGLKSNTKLKELRWKYLCLNRYPHVHKAWHDTSEAISEITYR